MFRRKNAVDKSESSPRYVAPGAAYASKEAPASNLKGRSRKKRGFFGTLCRIVKCVIALTILLLLILGGVLYYFLGTLDGARRALDLAQDYIPSNIIVDTTIEEGSFLEGLTLGNTLVDVQDVIAINADRLTLKYDLRDLIEGKLIINTLESDNLSVALNDKLFEGPSKETPPSEPFKLDFPIDIFLNNFKVTNFALNSKLVDVNLAELSLKASAQGSRLKVDDTLVDTLTVHLKNEQNVALQEEQAALASANDEALAVNIDGQIIKLSDLSDSAQTLVAAAQQGKSVEFVLVKETRAKEADETEKLLLSDVALNGVNQGRKVKERISSDSGSAAADAGSAGAGGTVASAVGATNVLDEAVSSALPAVYSDPELFAEGVEEALLNGTAVPTLISQVPQIHIPKPKVSNKGKLIAPDDFEGSLLTAVHEESNKPNPKEEKAANRFESQLLASNAKAQKVKNKDNEKGDKKPVIDKTALAAAQKTLLDDLVEAQKAQQAKKLANAGKAGAAGAAAANGKSAGSADGSADQPKAITKEELARAKAQEDAIFADAEAKRKAQEQAASKQAELANTLTKENDLDAVTGATASAIAQHAREVPSQKEIAVEDKIKAKTGSDVIVKEFGSGNGAIAPLPKVVLPFDIAVTNFKAKRVRYYMDGFDTDEADLYLDATWEDSRLNITKLELDHGMGELSLAGSLDLDKYFDLDVKLSGEGYKNEQNRDFLEGILYGLNGNFEVSGDLTDLKVKSVLNLGGSSELDVHANVLSPALPMVVSLKTRDFSYPIFGKPIVNLQKIDFSSAGNLVDGVDLSLNTDVSGFDFEHLKTDLKAQVSYEKSHIEKFTVTGTYQKQPLEARVLGDVFYGSVIGGDLKAYAKIKDAGFINPMLKGALDLDADLVAVINQKETGKSAVSVATDPAYLKDRIPKTAVSLEDLDPDTIEAKLLSQVNSNQKAGVAKGKGLTASGGSLKAGDIDEHNYVVNDNAQLLGGKTAGAALVKRRENALNGESLHDKGATAFDVESDDAAALYAGAVTPGATIHRATKEAVQAVKDGESLSVVRPLVRNQSVSDRATAKVPEMLAGGVADEPMDLLISKDEYVDAVRYNNEFDNGANGEDNFLAAIFNNDLPEVKANIRHVKSSLFLNGVKTTLDINNVVGDLQRGFRVDLIKLKQDKNVVLAEGQVTERGANLNAIVDLKDLSTLAPGVKGSFAAHLLSTGSIRDLNFEVAGSAPSIAFGDVRIRKLVFNTAFNMQTRALNMTALADRIRFSKSMSPNQQCYIDISGTPLRHNLSANCGGQASAYVSVDGSYDHLNGTYSANLLELYLSTESAGSISLTNPVFFDYDIAHQSGSFSPIELRGEVGLVTISSTSFSPELVKSKVNISQFNVNALSDLYPDNIKMVVPLDAELDVLVKNGNPDIKLNVTSGQGVVYSTVGAGLAYENLVLTSHVTKTLMHNEFNLNLRRGNGKIASVIDIHDPMGAGRLSGYFNIDSFNLKSISNIGQSFTDLNGFANLKTEFKGNLKKPLVYGDLTVKGDATPRYDVGQINSFDIKFHMLGQSGKLDGLINLNGGNLNLAGDLDWSNGPNGVLTANAKELPIFLLGYGNARANLDAKVTLGEVLDIEGAVHIPRADISVNNVASSGVSVSSDEILVPRTGTSTLMRQAPSSFKSKMNLKVSFGNDVKVAALGLVKGYVGGGLNIIKREDSNNILAQGEINLERGKADVYGRKFNIDTARVIFYDDIANPSLNVVVLADKDYLENDVEVGVKVTGTAKSPIIDLFSQPAMSQNEILSYILYGHGLDKGALQQDSNNNNMLLGLGISSASGLVSSLASSFGVKNIQLGTEGSGDETQVNVQGYINRRLRVSYGYGVFSAVGEFKLRYELVHHLYAEFVSSLDQAVDIIYSFEF